MSALDGVTFLDHTADVGISVEAGDLAGLFHRAALGMLALLRGREDMDGPDAPDPDASPRDGSPDYGSPDYGSRPDAAGDGDAGFRILDLEADGPAPLLADWLRELLFLHETAGRDYVRAGFERLDDRSLRARVLLEPSAPAVREIKGVTYHALHVRRTGGGWEGQVIFDV